MIARMTMNLEEITDKAVKAYKNNRLLNVNANIIAAAFPSIAAATGMSELMEYYGYPDGAIATAAAITDWVIYIPIHIGLHYKTNKEEFIDNQGDFQKKEFIKDVANLYVTRIPSIALFYVMAGPLHMYLMTKELGSGLANQISYWGTLAATRTVHTLIGLKTGLFKKRNKDYP